MSRPGLEAELQKRLELTKPGNVAAYIYTSGTTGEPKAVMMTHDTVCAGQMLEMALVQSALQHSILDIY